MSEHPITEQQTIDRAGQLFPQMVVGSNPIMRHVLHRIRTIAQSEATVLVCGETGTGKGMIARAIHHNSPRRSQDLVEVECTSIAPSLLESELFGYARGAFTGADSDRSGLFAAAQGGTIFLDEIGDLGLELQGKLLRVCEEKEYRPVGTTSRRKSDVRIIAATNRNLEEMMARNEFRKDLYYRIGTVSVTLPPLRERREDIPLLVQAFLTAQGRMLGRPVVQITNRAMDRLLEYDYPGNVRELRNIIQMSLLNSCGSAIGVEHLPPWAGRRSTPTGRGAEPFIRLPESTSSSGGFKHLRDTYLRQIEIQLLHRFLQEADGNISEAARRAEIDRSTFYRILQRQY